MYDKFIIWLAPTYLNKESPEADSTGSNAACLGGDDDITFTLPHAGTSDHFTARLPFRRQQAVTATYL